MEGGGGEGGRALSLFLPSLAFGEHLKNEEKKVDDILFSVKWLEKREKGLVSISSRRFSTCNSDA